MTERLGRVALGGLQGRSAAGGLVPRDTVNIIQSLGPSFSFGAFQGVDPSELISLIAAGSVAGYSTFHQTAEGTGAHSGGTDYQVPAGRQLVIGGIIFNGSGAGDRGLLGYGDTGVAWDNVAAPTAAVGLSSSALIIAAAATTLYSFTWVDKVPAGKFPYLYMVAAGTLRVKLICKLFNA